MLRELREKIDGKTSLLALLGSPVEHSKSPQMHNLSLSYLNLNYAYLAFDVAEKDLSEAVNAMKALNVAGFNLTMPHKSNIIPLLDELSAEAKLIDAVNTVYNKNGCLIGYNTDGMGYTMSLREENISLYDKKVVIAGARGAARSIAVQLCMEGAKEITILNRTLPPAEQLSQLLNDNFVQCRSSAYQLTEENMSKELQDADILINCTSLGMSPHEDKSIVEEPQILPKNIVVSDIVYSPSKTKLMKIADKAGCKNFNGLGMIVGQGALAFKIWTGKAMPIEIVKDKIF